MESGSKDVIMKHTGVPINTVDKVSTKFTKLRVIGKGAYGKVRLAKYKDKEGNVALKKIKKYKLTPSGSANQRREVQAAVNLEHPNIVRIYEVFENDLKIVLVMEYSDLGDLCSYLGDAEAEVGLVRKFFRQILSAVYFCHSHKICHRDLKLENVLVFKNEIVKLTDFGFANSFESGQLLSTFCGSIHYASPELIKNTPYQGPEVDCWALGVMLFSMLFMKMPFSGPNMEDFKLQICHAFIDLPEPNEHVRASLIKSAMPFITEILTVDTAHRPTIEQICQHEWVNIGYTKNCLEKAREVAASCRAPNFESLNEPLEDIKPSVAKVPQRSKIEDKQQRPTFQRPTVGWNICGKCMKPSESVPVELHELSLAPKTDENPMDIQEASTSTAHPEQRNIEREDLPSQRKRRKPIDERLV